MHTGNSAGGTGRQSRIRVTVHEYMPYNLALGRIIRYDDTVIYSDVEVADGIS